MLATLSIKKDLYRDYLNYLFEFQGSYYVVSRHNDFGKLLCARVQYSNIPLPQHEDLKAIRFLLPKSRPLATAQNYYLFYSKEDQQKINDDLEVLFNIDFDRYYLEGCKMGMMQKDVIQSFVISRRLVNMSIDTNETLKKRQYRDTVEILKKLTEKLNQTAFHRNRMISKAIFDVNAQLANNL
jgi:hypothetical protein